MKIALVNLTKLKDYATRGSYVDDMQFLKDSTIDYVDYCSGRENFDDLLAGFHEAVANPEIDLVWFVSGGTTLIKYLDRINWELVSTTKKKYLGISDFTHFSYKATLLGCECYYGAGLADIMFYFPKEEQRKHIVNFLKEGTFKELANNLNDEHIVGGHTIITTFMLTQEPINLSDKVLFLEYHNIPGEGFIEMEYYFDQLFYSIKNNVPKAFILGHSLMTDENGELIDYKKINEFLKPLFTRFGKEVYEVDHFQQLIKFSV